MPPDLEARLRKPDFVLLDGATGGALADRGIDTNCALWGSIALTTPKGRAVNRALHAEYVAAGAEVVIANTHNLGLTHCEAHLVAQGEDAAKAADLQEELHRAALVDARASGASWVAGCLASPEQPYATRATLTPEAVTAQLLPQAKILERLGFDLVFFEMLTTKSDVRGAAALPWFGPARGAGLVVSAEGTLLDGSSMSEAIRILAGGGFELVFVQCTPYSAVDAGLRSVVAESDAAGLVPGVYANDGRSWGGQGWCGPRVTPETYAARADEWRVAGARMIGGCCGTGPEHIRALNRLRGMC